MLAQEVNYEQESHLTAVYRTPLNPYTWKRVVWTLDYDDTFLYGFRNLNNSTHYMQSREGAPWRVQFAWEAAQSKWTRWNLAYAAGSWTIENNACKNAAEDTYFSNYFIGPWNSKKWVNGEVVAGNKQTDEVGHFKIYQILRTEYDANALNYPTNVTSLITNPSFDSGTVFCATKGNAVGSSITGWTVTNGGNWQFYSVAYSGQGSSVADNNSGYGKVLRGAEGKQYLNVRLCWQPCENVLKQTLSSLPEGEYTLSVYCKGATPSSTAPTLTMKAAPANGSTGGAKVSFPTSKTRNNNDYLLEDNYGDWTQVNYTFFVTANGNVEVSFTLNNNTPGNNSSGNDEIVLDNVCLTYKNYTATLQSALDRANLLYTRTSDSDLKDAIDHAQDVLDAANNTTAYQSTLNDEVTTLRSAISTAYAKVSFASGEDITFLLENASFESSDALPANVTTSFNNINTTDVYVKMQPVEGWTIGSTEDNILAGAYKYGTDYGISGYTAKDITTPIVGHENAIVMLAGWGAKSQYKQNVTLPAGRYSVSVPVYNRGGATAFTKNLIGFIENGGAEHLATRTSYSVGSWTTTTIEFDLNAETAGYMSVGYLSKSGEGSGNMPRLYIDGVTITYTDAANAYATTLAAATATYNDAAYTNVTGTEKTALYNAINPATAPSTVEEYFEAIDNINDAVDAFTAAKTNYDALVTAREEGATYTTVDWPRATAAKKTALDNAVAADAPTSSEDAGTKANAIVTAYRQFVESNGTAEGVSGAIDFASAIAGADPDVNTGWTNGIGVDNRDAEKYTDGEGHTSGKYYDGGWSTTAVADITMSRTMTLPAGAYQLQVTARGSSKLKEYTMSIGGNSVDLPKEGSGAAVGTFGHGWSDRYVVFESDGSELTLTIRAYSEGTDYQQWISFNRFRLYNLGDATVSKSITAAGWATYCSPYALDLEHATGLTDAYIVTGGNAGVLAMTSVKDGTVPANTGLLLKGDEGTVTIPVVASSSTDVDANKLVGVTAATDIAANAGYVLMASPKLGFYKNANAFTVGANTAYLPIDFDENNTGARSAFFGFDENVTAINAVEATETEAGALKDGKYLINNKIVLVKNGVKYGANGQFLK